MRRAWIPLLLALLLGCPADETAPPPDLNFIPLYDDICEPTTQAELDSARTALDALVEPVDGRTDWVVRDLSLCGPDSCSPCDSNPLKELFDALDDEFWFVEGARAEDFVMSSAEFVDRALDYPVRDLTLQVQDQDGLGLITLSESREIACGYLPADGGDMVSCDHHELQITTLASDCQTAPLSMLGIRMEGAASTTVEAAGTSPFGFVVPLALELPDPSSFATVNQLQSWVALQPRLGVKGMDPGVSINHDGETGCFGMTTRVPVANLFEVWEDDQDAMSDLALLLQAREIPVSGGTIELKLSGNLEPAVLTHALPETLEGSP
jgi:hypothetical protein